MHKGVRFASEIPPSFQPRQSGLRPDNSALGWSNSKALPSPFDLDRRTRIEHLVKYAVHVLSQV